MIRRKLLLGIAGPTIVAALAAGVAGAQSPQQVMARDSEHGANGIRVFGEWKQHPVFTMQNLPAQPRAVAEDKFGGRQDRGGTKTGFYHPEKIGGRWWLVDPAGQLYLSDGVATVTAGPSEKMRAALAKSFGTEAQWMSRTHQQLLDNGNNSVGAWSDVDALRASPLQAAHPLAYTINVDVMGAYAHKRGGTHKVPGHTGYPEDMIFIFDPQFPAFAAEYLKKVEAYRDDPNLLGYFSDNEIPLLPGNLEGFLRLPKDDPGHIAAAQWLKYQHADAPDEALSEAFLAFEADRYFSIVTTALRQHDPHHMYLGCRFYGHQLKDPVMFRAVGKYAGAVSVNFYDGWQPKPEMMAMWEQEAQRPFLITEFYTKGEDSGMPNRTGAGMEVRTQADRGLYYQNFVLALLASRNCVGWHWFRYQDNDPSDKHAELSNQDSNKGIVNVEYEPYAPLLKRMQELNRSLYGVVDVLDAPAKSGSKP